jgi:hypothetical protein
VILQAQDLSLQVGYLGVLDAGSYRRVQAIDWQKQSLDSGEVRGPKAENYPTPVDMRTGAPAGMGLVVGWGSRRCDAPVRKLLLAVVMASPMSPYHDSVDSRTMF